MTILHIIVLKVKPILREVYINFVFDCSLAQFKKSQWHACQYFSTCSTSVKSSQVSLFQICASISNSWFIFKETVDQTEESSLREGEIDTSTGERININIPTHIRQEDGQDKSTAFGTCS